MSFGNREPIPKELRSEVKSKFGGYCAYCGIQLKKSFHVDHVIPVARGGVDDIVNFFPSCRHCNTMKSDSSINEFRTFLESQYLRSAMILAERFEMIKIIGPVKIVFHFEKQGYVFPEELVRLLMRQQYEQRIKLDSLPD